MEISKEIHSKSIARNNDVRFANSDHRKLPVIDLGPLIRGDVNAVQNIATPWRQACENLGFLCVVNHGIDKVLINNMELQSRCFHGNLSVDQKMAVKVTRDQKGFIPSKAMIISHSTYHDHTKFDSVECFVAATDFPSDHPEVKKGTQFYGQTPWPNDDLLPGFRETVSRYMLEIKKLGISLLPVWEQALDLNPGFFKPSFLPPALEAGLQILDTEKKWFWPIVPEGAIIVNIGQFLARWSNDRFRATPHRVLPPKDTDRFSFACFVNTDLEAIAECLPSCRPKVGPNKYEPQSYRSYFEWYMKRTYVHYNELSPSDMP